MSRTAHMSFRNLHRKNPPKADAEINAQSTLLTNHAVDEHLWNHVIDLIQEKISAGIFSNGKRVPNWKQCKSCWAGFVFAQEDQGIVAASCALLVPVGTVSQHTGTASLEYVMTRDGYTGKGLAKAVCTTLLHTAKEKGFERVILKCDPDSPERLLEKYNKLGFQLDYMQSNSED